MRRQITALLVLPFLFSTANAQTGLTISGVVHEQGTGNPVSGAEVSIVGGKANQDVTDSLGKFSLRFFTDVKPGTLVRIRVVKKGYKTYTDTIPVSSEVSVPISLENLSRTKSHSSSQSTSTEPTIEQLQGKLLPSDEPTPATSCPQFVGNGIFILMGFVTSYVDRFPHTVLMVDDKPRLVVHRESDGAIWLSLDIFGADGKIIATLDEDGFSVRPKSYFKLKKDKSSLRIVDEYNQEVLNVRYINSQAIWINALLRYPGSNPVTFKGSDGGGICTAHGGTAEVNISTKPTLATSPTEKALPPGVIAPPPVQNIRIVSQDYISSEDALAPYKLRVVVQTNVRIEPVSFVFHCSEIIERGQVSFSGDGGLVSFKDRTGVLLEHKDGFLVSFESPAFTPEKPMLLDLYSKRPFKVLEFGQIPFTF